MTIIKENISKYRLDELLACASAERKSEALLYSYEERIKTKLLGEYILRKVLNRDVIILKDKNGKPYVDIPNFFFNISHSGDVLILAYDSKEIGVDIEFIKERDISLYKAFFHEKEVDFLDKSKNKLEDFYKIWTLKESYYKLVGSVASKDFHVLPYSSVNATFTQYRDGDYLIAIAQF